MNKSKFLVLMGILLIFGFTSCNKNGEKVTIKTNQPEIVNAHHAKITGTIKSLDKSINELWAYGYCLGEEPNPDMSQMVSCVYATNHDHPDVSLPRPFEYTLVGLEQETEYHFRAFAFITSNERPIFGEDVCITTSGK